VPAEATGTGWHVRASTTRGGAAVLAGTAAIALHASRFGNWIVDDAAITFAYARSLATGDGPVLMPGADPVEAFSNPAWLALLWLGRVTGLFDRGTIFGIPDQVLYPKALALLCCAGILVACFRAASAVSRRPALVTLVAGLGLATVPSFVIWSFSGLENALFALFVALLATTLCRAAVAGRLDSPRVALTAGLLAAGASLTRPDGAAYALALPVLVAIWLPPRPAARQTVVSLGAFAVPYGAYVLWRVLTFGHPLSAPAIAKGQAPPAIETLMRVGEIVTYGGALTALVLAVCAGLVLARPSPTRTGVIALLVPLGLAIAAHTVLVPDWMGHLRFATPVWPLAALVGTLAVGEALTRLAPRGRTVLAAGIVLAVVPSLLTFRAASAGFRAAPTVPMCRIAERFGEVFDDYADRLGVERGTLLLPDVGGTALTSRLEIVDLAGLASYRIAELRGAGDMAGLRDYVFEERRPTFIHTHGAWDAGLSADPRLERDYVWLYRGEGTDSDWVRRDIADGHDIAALRDHAARMVFEKRAAPPLRHCTATYRG
jgi:hypothetical protein